MCVGQIIFETNFVLDFVSIENMLYLIICF